MMFKRRTSGILYGYYVYSSFAHQKRLSCILPRSVISILPGSFDPGVHVSCTTLVALYIKSFYCLKIGVTKEVSFH